ncbi:MAG: FtsW/RodA/SpoVE family cell cycle protein [Bacteroidales bacterium]|nr:FtsW/RodA/SpoVE family cell cycle protein [Bacteroidales bacterium]
MKVKLLRPKGDQVIWILVLLFAMISILAVFSSSTYRANTNDVTKVSLFFEQIRFVLLGFLTMFVCYALPTRFYRNIAFLAFAASIVLLIMTFIPHFSHRINGAVRGVKIAGIPIQVFELAKVGLVIYLARALEFWKDSLDTFKDFFLKLLLPIIAVCGLVMANSFSSAILFGLISFALLYFMGVKVKFLLISLAGAAVAVVLLFGVYNVAFAGRQHPEGYQPNTVEKLFNRFGTVQSRFEKFFDDIGGAESEEEEFLTKEDKMRHLDEIRQSENAKVAISEGGLLGKGPGKSTQRYSLSMAFSDFIFAFIVEEYGFFGGAFVILLYTIFLFRCIRISQKCQSTFASSLVLGLAFLLAIQAMLHIFVNVRLIPITGHTLPLISHGGTAYIILSGAFGMILSASRQADEQIRRQERLAREQASELQEPAEDTLADTTDNNEEDF